MKLDRPFWLILGCLLVLLVGCTDALPTPSALPSPSPQEVTLTLPTLLAEPQRWSGTPLTLIIGSDAELDDQRLALATPVRDATQALMAIWLTQPISDSLASATALSVYGTLSPPGAYGPDQQYTYQFSADDVQALQAERTTLANLADNPRALDRILLTVEGTLLAQGNSVLLVDQVTEQGVPTQNARQIKLAPDAVDAQVLDRLRRSGDVRWGAVRITGWWSDATMTPLSTEVLAP